MTSTTTDRRSGASTPGTASDRLNGPSGKTAYKDPCKVATTANITLSGLQTIDGVTLVADDRVLVKDQSTASQNGIYIASSGNWERAPDWDDARDVVEGTRVWVTDGSVNDVTEFVVTSANPITPGTTSVTLAATSSLSGGALLAANNLSDVADQFTALRNLMENGSTIVCANPLVLTSAGGDMVDVSGNTNFSAVTLAEGKSQWVRFTGTPTITVGASLIGNGGGSNVTLAAGDIVFFRGYAAGVVRFIVFRLSGKAVVPTVAAADLPAAYISPERFPILSNDAGDLTNDIAFAAASLWDSTFTARATIGAMVKRLDGDWAAGTGNGGRYSGAAIADTTYNCYAVFQAAGANPDYYLHPHGSTDAQVLAHLQAETGGASYLYVQRVGCVLRESGVLVRFVQTGKKFKRTPVNSINSVIANTNAITRVLHVPVGTIVDAIIGFVLTGDRDNDVAVYGLLTDLASVDTAPTATINNISAVMTSVSTTNAAQGGGTEIVVTTDTAASIRSRSNLATATTVLTLTSMGWIDVSLRGL